MHSAITKTILIALLLIGVNVWAQSSHMIRPLMHTHTEDDSCCRNNEFTLLGKRDRTHDNLNHHMCLVYTVYGFSLGSS